MNARLVDECRRFALRAIDGVQDPIKPALIIIQNQATMKESKIGPSELTAKFKEAHRGNSHELAEVFSTISCWSLPKVDEPGAGSDQDLLVESRIDEILGFIKRETASRMQWMFAQHLFIAGKNWWRLLVHVVACAADGTPITMPLILAKSKEPRSGDFSDCRLIFCALTDKGIDEGEALRIVLLHLARLLAKLAVSSDKPTIALEGLVITADRFVQEELQSLLRCSACNDSLFDRQVKCGKRRISHADSHRSSERCMCSPET